jgi:hypothetical protein
MATGFIDTFVQYTHNLPSSELWRKWAAIAAVAGALERRVWVYTLGSNLYPNMYTFLIGPPGVGKTVLSSVVQDLWLSTENINVAPSSCSAQSFVDSLRHGEQRVVRPTETPPVISYNGVCAAVNELGVFLTEYSGEFVATLTDLYDGKRYAERKRTAKLEYTIDNPCVNMLACGTPSYLGTFLPEGAWDQGFMSRVIMIYSGVMARPSLFGVETTDKDLFELLKKQIKSIRELYGKCTFKPDVIETLTAWYNAGGLPVPDHPKLLNYNTRRTAKLLKLCMVACVDAGGSLVITLEHYQRALGWLIEAEANMPEVFKSFTSGGSSKIIEELWYACYDYLVKKKTGMPEPMVYEFLATRVATVAVEPLLRQIIAAKILGLDKDANGQRVYMPKDRTRSAM